MPRNDTIAKGGPAGPAGARNDARWRGAPPAGSATPHGRAHMLVLLLGFILASVVTATGFFVNDVPLWVAGLPLIAAIVAGYGRRSITAIAFAAFALWPAMLCAAGLTGIGFEPHLVWPLALIAVIALAWLASLTGVVLLALIVTAIPAFPASPLPVLADVVPGTGLVGPVVLLLCLAIVEFMPRHGRTDLRDRAGTAAMIAAGVIIWNLAMAAHPADVADVGTVAERQLIKWRPMDEPRAITERGRWIALRDMLPEGSQAIFGENVFAADDDAAIAFWCDAARRRDLTLWIGVRVDPLAADPPPESAGTAETEIRRGAVMRFDPQTCAWSKPAFSGGFLTGQPGGSPAALRCRQETCRRSQQGPQVVHAAQRGIPGITGTWGRMEPLQAMAAHSDQPDANAAGKPEGDTSDEPDGDASGKPDGDASGEPDGDGPVSAWLICYEAFLVPSWIDVFRELRQAPANRPIVVLSNDGAFGNLPVSRLRRKVTRAMAGLASRTVLHAETGRTILVNGGSSRRNVDGGSSRRNVNGGSSRREETAGPAAATRANEPRGQ